MSKEGIWPTGMGGKEPRGEKPATGLLLLNWRRKLYPQPKRERGKNGLSCAEVAGEEERDGESESDDP